MQRYTSERCGTCGQGLTWIEIAFGRFLDPVCGACLRLRPNQGLSAPPCPHCGGMAHEDGTCNAE